MLRYPEITKEGLKRAFSPYKKVISNLNLGNYKKFIPNFPKLKTNYFKTAEEIKKIPEITSKSDLIRLSSVSKSFGKNNVINNVSLTIPKGKILGLVGISGSGKTTLLKMLVGFYKPTKGSVIVNGKDIEKHNRSIKRSFGFGSQENCFYGKLNVEENVRYFGELYGLTAEFVNSRIQNVLSLVGLYESRKTLADNLSTGMKRRLDIACSLIHDPNIIILDEPTEDLDLNLRKDILGLIKKINRNGKTIIMTSHLLGEIENVCDVVGILSNGKIAKLGSPEELKREYSKDFEIHLQTTSGKYNSLIKGLKVKKTVKKGKSLLIYVSDGEKAVRKIISRSKKNKDKIISLKLGRPSLSEVFEAYTHVNKEK